MGKDVGFVLISTRLCDCRKNKTCNGTLTYILVKTPVQRYNDGIVMYESFMTKILQVQCVLLSRYISDDDVDMYNYILSSLYSTYIYTNSTNQQLKKLTGENFGI